MSSLKRAPLQIEIPLSAIAEELRGRVGEEAPRPLRMALAKAALPVDPGELLVVLSYLAQGTDEEIVSAAMQSMGELPEQFVRTKLAEKTLHPNVLEFFCHAFMRDERYIEVLLVNASTPDTAFVAMSKGLTNPDWLDLISRNQVRFLRSPEIIEAMFYNPETRMSAVSRMLETAARSGLELGHIPGFREVQAGILGKEELARQRDAGEISSQEFEELSDGDGGDGLDDEAFMALLLEAANEAEVPADGSESEEDEKVPMWRAISNMKTSQKMRLAILGNAAARKILIRDPKKVVAVAVLRSPRITDKEIAFFATQKSLTEDVIRLIAKNREWTRHYGTKVALVKNPKTPPQQSMWFLKSLHMADLKGIARDRDVPGVISKAAKRMVDQKTSGTKR